MRHYSKKADRNQPELVKYIRGRGATFQHTHQVEGALDGIIGFRGIDQRVEIKNPDHPESARKLTVPEQKAFDTWKGRPPIVIESIDDCEQLLKQLYREASELKRRSRPTLPCLHVRQGRLKQLNTEATNTMKYRKKPVIIEATQWFKNGDHPEDGTETFEGGGFKGELLEGKVVRYYRSPDCGGQNKCKLCNSIMHLHGWIETLEGGHVVCPGDLIITGVQGERYPCKPDIFKMSYESAE